MSILFKSCFLVLFTAISFAQDGADIKLDKAIDMEIRLDGNRLRQISEADLRKAKTLTDLYERYPADWMETYKSVVLSVTCNEETLQATSASHELSEEQLSLLQLADNGTMIHMDVRYIADNSLVNKVEREVDYSVLVIPAKQANFDGGEEEILQYVEENAIMKIQEAGAYIEEFAIILFTIDQNGKVINLKLEKSADNEVADKIILNAFKNMPDWNPAVTHNGSKVNQDYKFIIGDLNLCSFYGM